MPAWVTIELALFLPILMGMGYLIKWRTTSEHRFTKVEAKSKNNNNMIEQQKEIRKEDKEECNHRLSKLENESDNRFDDVHSRINDVHREIRSIDTNLAELKGSVESKLDMLINNFIMKKDNE